MNENKTRQSVLLRLLQKGKLLIRVNSEARKGIHEQPRPCLRLLPHRRGETKKTIAELIHAIGLDQAEFDRRNPNYPLDDWERLEPEHLFAACNRCPACSLAAIRQSGSHAFVEFDFRDEAKSFFDEIHAGEDRECAHG